MSAFWCPVSELPTTSASRWKWWAADRLLSYDCTRNALNWRSNDAILFDKAPEMGAIHWERIHRENSSRENSSREFTGKQARSHSATAILRSPQRRNSYFERVYELFLNWIEAIQNTNFTLQSRRIRHLRLMRSGLAIPGCRRAFRRRVPGRTLIKAVRRVKWVNYQCCSIARLDPSARLPAILLRAPLSLASR